MIKNLKKSITTLAIASMLAIPMMTTSMSAQAASVNVSKLRLVLDDKKSSDYITLTNEDTDKTSFENTVHKWRQKDGYVSGDNIVAAETVLEDTENVFISPSTLVILPQANRTLRAIIEDKDKAYEDFSYRIQVKQLNTRESPVQTNTINLLFNISIPLFVQKEANLKADEFALTSKFLPLGSTGKTVLSIKNNEKQHIQILGVYESLEVPKGKDVEDKFADLNGYILPGVTNVYIIPEFANKMQKIRVKTDKGDLIISK